MNKQLVISPTGDRMVMIPEAEYDALVEAVEDAEDIASVRVVEAKLAAGEEEYIPSDVAMRFIDGENPIRVWREFRGLSLAALAEQAKLLENELAEIETDQREPSIQNLKHIAAALKLTIDDIVR